MTEGQLFAAVNGSVALMRVVGLGTLKLTDGFQKWIEELKKNQVLKSVVIDLSSCTHLDSTFMGLMSSLTLVKGRKCQFLVANASPQLRQLLTGIGVMKRWKFANTSEHELDFTHGVALANAQAGAFSISDDMKRVILEAHEALVANDPAQQAVFQPVIEALKAEIHSKN